jgi:diguanylate cyclase (GGDEF)-like protein
MTKHAAFGIKAKLIFAFTAVSLLTALIALFAIKQNIDGAETAALIEAEHMAMSLAYTGIDDVIIKNPQFLTNYVKGLQTIKRDLTIVDTNRIIVADTDHADVEQVYSDDTHNEVAHTLKDGIPRHFTEVSPLFPLGTKQIVVPMRRDSSGADSPIIGAVILEYGPIHDELMAIAKSKSRLIMLAAALAVVIAVFSGSVIATRLTKPLSELTRAATDFASGQFERRVQYSQRNEMGVLAEAFNGMAEQLNTSRDELVTYGRNLESDVAIRTKELQEARANLEQRVEERTRELNAATRELTRQTEELAERNLEITLFSKLNQYLQASNSEAEAYSVISTTAKQLFPHDSGALFIFSASRNMLEANAVWGPAPPAQVVFPPNECWALQRGQAHLGTVREVRCRHVDENCQTYACVPLVAQGESLGVLHIANRPLDGDETHIAEKYRIAKAFAENMGIALANLKLRDAMRALSIRDPLTGLFNRRYMEEVLAQEFHRAKRLSTQVAAIMIDIDHFKRFNDEFGHDAGDAVLRELAHFLLKHVRGGDIACRYGGEEFILILSPTTAEGAEARARQICEGARHVSVKHANQTLGAITLSLGVATFPDQAATAEELVKAGDVALYEAKRAGRDRVVVSRADYDRDGRPDQGNTAQP